MILPSEGEEEGAVPQALEPQVTFEDPTPAAPINQPTSTIVEEEEVEVLAKELEKLLLLSIN